MSGKEDAIPSLLGDYSIPKISFSDLDERIGSFQDSSFMLLGSRTQIQRIHEHLLAAILDSPLESFLLPAVVEFIERVNDAGFLQEPYTLASFEFWLNHFSLLSFEENRLVRGKIAGKWIPRDEYQSLFPIGMGKVFFGTHFVAAHLSPDVDTTIASFWGWLDAFATRVGTGLHRWALPGGPPTAPFAKTFRETFGNTAFPLLARTDTTLLLTAMDLLTQEGIRQERADTLTNNIVHSVRGEAVFLLDEQKRLLGEWRRSDLELVRPVVIAFKSLLHWLENTLLIEFISLLSHDIVNKNDLESFTRWLFQVPLRQISPVEDFSERQRESLHALLLHVLGISRGIEGTFADISQAFAQRSIFEMETFLQKLHAFYQSDLFDEKGILQEKRPEIFRHLEQLIRILDEAIGAIRNYVERLDSNIAIKKSVLHLPFPQLSLKSDVEEIRLKMENWDYLAVTSTEPSSLPFPMGVVRAQDIRQPVLGTVSFRDFCNPQEVKMASYLQVISVMDHHKTSLQTVSTPVATISDAQSCNVLVAEEAFAINDKWSFGGLTPITMEEQLEELRDHQESSHTIRLYTRLLRRYEALHRRGESFIHPHREFTEYLFFLLAIVDDTDLLTKVSDRDVRCVVSLLNRLKALSIGKEVEILNDEGIPRGEAYASQLAKRILQSPEMYSIYSKIYAYKEQEIEENLRRCTEGDYSTIFADTKEQNGCARVGQTKVFSTNIPTFWKIASHLRKEWVRLAEKTYLSRPVTDLHLHMMSTIPSAEEVYQDRIGQYEHKDEMWIWVPATQQAYAHLGSFLSAFQMAPEVIHNEMELSLSGPHAEDLQQLFQRNFRVIVREESIEQEPGRSLAVLRFRAGSLNSRKAMVSPYLPQEIA